jgi:2-hydroxy-6-oxonona-2,4-dienedioate hydrolase
MVEKDVAVRGFRLHYREAGHGAPVILLHGMGGDGSRWATNMRPLANDFRVIALDQIGFGQSDKPLANYHTGMLSEFLVDFLDAVGLPKASLVGHSMGAFVAAYTAVHYREVIDRLVLVNGAGYRRGPGAPALDPRRKQIQNGVTRDETREFFSLSFHNKDLVTKEMVDENLGLRLRSAFAISRMQESFELGLGRLSDEEMRSIEAPTLIVWGRHDRLLGPPERMGERLRRDISGARLVVIDEAGHFPQQEQPDEFNRIVREYLKSAPVQPEPGDA